MRHGENEVGLQALDSYFLKYTTSCHVCCYHPHPQSLAVSTSLSRPGLAVPTSLTDPGVTTPPPPTPAHNLCQRVWIITRSPRLSLCRPKLLQILSPCVLSAYSWRGGRASSSREWGSRQYTGRQKLEHFRMTERQAWPSVNNSYSLSSVIGRNRDWTRPWYGANKLFADIFRPRCFYIHKMLTCQTNSTIGFSWVRKSDKPVNHSY